jgi:hypothetical protein
MKTNISITSLMAYKSLKASGFKGQKAAIVSHMEPETVYSRRQLAKMTGLETSAVAGRCNDLVADRVLVDCGKIKCPISGELVNGIKVAEAQMELLG